MKKLLSIMAVFACVFTAGITMMACGEEPKAPVSYNVILPSSSEYTITADKETASEGDVVSLEIEVTNIAKEVESVYANEVVCEFVDNVYSFTMPAEDVTVTVNLQDKTFTEVLVDGQVEWALYNPNQIVTSSAQYAEDTIYINYTEGVNNPEITVTSTNQDVIPASAIGEVLDWDLDMGSMKAYSYFDIDLNQVTVGTTYLIINVNSDSVTNVDATIIKKIDVVEQDDLVIDTWSTSLTLDLSRLTSYMFVNIQVFDWDAQYGSTMQTISTIGSPSEGDGEVTIDIDYVPYHRYRVSVYVNENGANKVFDIDDTQGTGSSISGYNQYIDGYLTFFEDGGSLTLDVLTSTHS